MRLNFELTNQDSAGGENCTVLTSLFVSRAMGQNFLVRTKLANSLGRTKLTNSPGRTKLNNPLRKQELELYDWLLIGSSTLKQWQISVPASVSQIFFLSLFRL